MIAAEPELVLELLDAASVAFTGEAVIHGAEQFTLGNPFEESALDAVRGLLAADLADGASVSVESDRLVIEGARAAWQLRNDAQAVTGVEAVVHPDEAIDTDAEPEAGIPPDRAAGGASMPARPASDLVDQLERLVSIRDRGHLTDAEFAAAKAQLLG